ncbi:MAG: hypothetical protein Q7J65_01320 [Candidatus Marinimicrobia bacterium]|nr:hypothetical protein [Candidatus Neomarinimicrobiota bacterium]
MHTVKQEYIIDKQGNKKAVILPFSEWQKILNDIEELNNIRTYDKAKTRKQSIGLNGYGFMKMNDITPDRCRRFKPEWDDSYKMLVVTLPQK